MRKLIGGIDFGPIWAMSGTLNFFGEGWPFHKLYKKWFGERFSFDGITFVAKTTTLEPRIGNMPMREDGITPQEWRPGCIILGPWQFLTGVMLNAVGLSGPGARNLFSCGLWRERVWPFMISFMSVAKTLPGRMEESEQFLKLLAAEIPNFHAPICIQKNITCPNVEGHGKPSDAAMINEEFLFMDMVGRYTPDTLVVHKVNTLVSPETAVTLSSHSQCGGICVSNTLPWAALTRRQKAHSFPSSIFTGRSPLERFGGGGLSGKPLLPFVEQWIRDVRLAGFEKHINAGGGILSADDVTRLYLAGADSVSIGSVAALRPWRLDGIIRRAYQVFPYAYLTKGESNANRAR